MINSCSFCDQNTITKQEIAVLGPIRILYPRRPVIPANVLIAPLRCVEHIHDLSDEEINGIFLVVRKIHLSFQNLYNTSGYNFFANDGRAAGQQVPHVHFHFYGRGEDEEVNPFQILNNKDKYINRSLMPEGEYHKNINQIKKSLLLL